MIKLCLSSASIAVLLSVSAAHSEGVAKHKKPKPQEPAVETTAVPPDPVSMQKWFSGAVDDILTNTDRTLKDTDRTLKDLQGPDR